MKLPDYGITTSPYQLADDIFSCISDGRMVFLDLPRNKYLCLNKQNTQAALQLLTSTPATSSAKDETATITDIRRVAEALKGGGLIVQHVLSRGAAKGASLQKARFSLLQEKAKSKVTFPSHYWGTFLLETLTTSMKLRWYSLHRIVEALRLRQQLRGDAQTFDIEKLEKVVAAYHQMRPYDASQSRCLYDSLVLIGFLAHYRIYPRLVFGVTAEPFGAHCWLQRDHYVLNDSVEYVNAFAPIMIV